MSFYPLSLSRHPSQVKHQTHRVLDDVLSLVEKKSLSTTKISATHRHGAAVAAAVDAAMVVPNHHCVDRVQHLSLGFVVGHW